MSANASPRRPFRSVLRWLRGARDAAPAPARRRLAVESLEDRTLLDASALLVQFLPGYVHDSTYADLLARHPDAELTDTTLPGVVRIAGERDDLDGLRAEFAARADTAYAEFEKTLSVALAPDDPRYTDGTLWGLSGTNGVKAATAWDGTTGSTKIVVAVIDTGIDYTHRDLYRNIWINQAEIPTAVKSAIQDNLNWDVDGDGLITFWDLNDSRNQGTGEITDLDGDTRITGADLLYSTLLGGWADGSDTDSNGYKDDLIGWDFVNGDNNPMDDNSHGTHVAGTIGATGNDSYGVVGVNWKVQMMPVKFMGSNGSGSDAAAAAAVRYSADRGAVISSNSWGGDSSTTVSNAINYAGGKGQLFVAAAGNSGADADTEPDYPAAYSLSNIISVASTTSSGGRSSFSNYGDESVDLGAPGSSIYSTVPGGYGTKSGTSMAAPHVAGVAALVKAKYPDMTVSELKDRILSTVTPLSSLSGITVTGGLVNAAEAVKEAPEVAVYDGTTSLTDGGSTVSFGSSLPSATVTKTFTVKNVGTSTLTLGSTISVPTGFTLVSGFNSTALTAGVTTTFQVRFNAYVSGTYGGQVSFTTNDGNENPFNFTVSGAVVNSLILDNGDAGYTESGSGWFNSSGTFYNGGARANAAGTGSASATWQFTALPEGSYQVQASWGGYSDQASNAVFRVYDGTDVEGSATVNQKQNSSGTTVGSMQFQTLATVNISSGTLRVVLTDQADAYVIADAVRVVPVAPPTVDLNWTGGSLTAPATATTASTFTVSRTYNVGGAAVADNFTIGYYASANSTFGDADDVLLGTETVSAAADKTVGTHSGTSPALQISAPGTFYLFAKVDGGGAVAETSESNNVQQVAQQVTVTGTAAPVVLDNGGTGYSESGSGWFNTTGGVYGGGGRANAAGSGGDTAAWQTSLTAGTYQIQATWDGYSDQASDATFKIYQGTTLLATAAVNQKQDPTGTTVGGAVFQTLASVTLTAGGGDLRVVLSDSADGYVIADAVRVVPTAAPTSDLNWSGGSLTASATATTASAFTVSRTYNVGGAAVADNFTIGYYASANSTFGDADDVLIGTESITAAADKTVGTHSGTSPALQISVPGTFYLFAKVDGGGAVAETNEGNNVLQASGQVAVSGSVVLDNGGTGYSESGSGWFNTTGGVYGGGGRANAAGSGGDTAAWQTSLTAGTYQIQATWDGYSDQASNAAFKVYQGTTLLATAAVNQKQDPTGTTVGGAVFQTLASVTLTSGGGDLRVVLSDSADGYVIADAVRIVSA